MRITQERADELRRKAEAATPGPWEKVFHTIEASDKGRSRGIDDHTSPNVRTSWVHGQAKSRLDIAYCSAGIGNYKTDRWAEINDRDADHIAAANPATMLDLLADRDEMLAEVATLRSAMRLIAGQIVVHNEKLADAPMSASEHLGEALDVALRFAPGDSPGASEIRSEEWTTKQMLVAEVERLRAKCEERKAVLVKYERALVCLADGMFGTRCACCDDSSGELHEPDCAWKRAMEDA